MQRWKRWVRAGHVIIKEKERERERERKYIDFEKDEENVRAWEKNREIEREKRRKEEQKD